MGWQKRWAHGVVVSVALPESSQGRRGGGRETCGGTLPSFQDVKTVHWRWPASARGRGGMGAEHQSWPYRAHRAVPDEMACEWQGYSLPFMRQAGPYVHQWQAAAMPPPNTWDPGDNSKVPSSSECNWGEVLSPSRITVPLMKVAWGGSRR